MSKEITTNVSEEFKIGVKSGYKKAIEEMEESINQLQEFLESDLYTKFKPENEFGIREDVFKNEEEFIKYIESHFNLLKEQIKKEFSE